MRNRALTHASIEDLAQSENISPSFVSRTLRLAYLSPALVEAILDGKYPAHLMMKDLLEPFPMEWEWERQRERRKRLRRIDFYPTLPTLAVIGNQADGRYGNDFSSIISRMILSCNLGTPA